MNIHRRMLAGRQSVRAATFKLAYLQAEEILLNW